MANKQYESVPPRLAALAKPDLESAEVIAAAIDDLANSQQGKA